MTNFEMVKAFHKAFRVAAASVPTAISEERKKLRAALIDEEREELDVAMQNDYLIGIADGLADLLYVVYGTAVEYGIDIDAVFAEVHRSNMSKGIKCANCKGFGRDSSPDESWCRKCHGSGIEGVLLRHDGKILKSINYCPPDIQGVIDHQFGWLDSVTLL